MKKNWKYSLLLIVAVFALTMGIFFLFYRFDNKYTARGDQAIQGILYVSDDDSVHYLAREWEYYPDVLLTPQEIKEQKEDYYSRYVSIGEYGGMDLGDKNKSPFGSGTYRMTQGKSTLFCSNRRWLRQGNSCGCRFCRYYTDYGQWNERHLPRDCYSTGTEHCFE